MTIFLLFSEKQVALEEHPLSVRNNSTYRQPLEHFAAHSGEVCVAAAKNLQIYDGSERDVLNAVATLMVTVLTFRRACLRHLLSVVSEAERGGLLPPADNDHAALAAATLRAALCRTLLDKAGIKRLIREAEHSLAVLVGDEQQQASAILANSDKVGIAEQERLLGELLGIPVPCHCAAAHCHSSQQQPSAGGLVFAQCLAEAALWRTTQYLQSEKELLCGEEAAIQKPLADSQALRDIQRDLHDTLWTAEDGELGAGGKRKKVFKLKSGGGREGHQSASAQLFEVEEDAIQVVEEANALMHRQRVEQTSRFLELLNAKAARKKKIIHSLMSLWKSTKVAVSHRNTVSSFSDTAETRAHMRLYAMPVEDIVGQTRQVQKVLIDDMQRPEPTKTAQLAERIALMRRGVQSRAIADEDGEISAALGEVDELEARLLQANSDAMKLAVKILHSLEQ